ncbi:MAG: NAD(P)H-binding protein, partial [Myxococcales bacterium]|nr:NAD(P)H-binding protein [Myxococcales bacterium]
MVRGDGTVAPGPVATAPLRVAGRSRGAPRSAQRRVRWYAPGVLTESPAARAFVAGATGYTGRAVVEALRAQGIETVAHVRPDSSRKAEFQARFAALGATVDHTPWEAEAIGETLRRVQPTLVFALLGTTRARARNEGMAATQAYARVDYGLTKWLVDGAVTCRPQPRFVYLSAAGVAADARGAYVAARARSEAALRDSDLPWTIARPSFITGVDRDESRPLERVGAALGDGLLAIAGLLGGR